MNGGFRGLVAVELLFVGASAQSLFELRGDPSEAVSLIDARPSVSNALSNALESISLMNALSFSESEMYAMVDLARDRGGWVPIDEEDYFQWETPQRYNSGPPPDDWRPPHLIFILADDWGWNDIGAESTWVSWATPTIDRLASEGIVLENHIAAWLCSPSRASLLTGRYSANTGFWRGYGMLPTDESTIAQELKTAGFATAMIGKWHMGFKSASMLPSKRGFDYSYSMYWNPSSHLTKKSVFGYKWGWAEYTANFTLLDLHENDHLVSDAGDLSSDVHLGELMSIKAVNAMNAHHDAHPNDDDRVPLFLYYAPVLVHSPFDETPAMYTSRCGGFEANQTDAGGSVAVHGLCGLIVMFDDSVADIQCTVEQFGWSNETVMVVVSDNGGVADTGNSPLQGWKGSLFEGGVRTRAIVHAPGILPESASGVRFRGLSHITDWFPTLMCIATNGIWHSSASLSGHTLDGVDLWSTLVAASPNAENLWSPRTEVIINHDEDGNGAIIRSYNNGQKLFKYILGGISVGVGTPDYVTYDRNQRDNDAASCNHLNFKATLPTPVLTNVAIPMPTAVPVPMPITAAPTAVQTPSPTPSPKKDSKRGDPTAAVLIALAVLLVVGVGVAGALHMNKPKADPQEEETQMVVMPQGVPVSYAPPTDVTSIEVVTNSSGNLGDEGAPSAPEWSSE